MTSRHPEDRLEGCPIVSDLDALDLALISALRAHPRAGTLELSRLTKVARATVQSRLRRMESSGIITGYGPDVDLAAAGHPVQAFVTLEIAQGALAEVRAELERLHWVVEAYSTTGSGDVVCRVAASSHADLQTALLELDGSPSVARSTSVVVLSVVVAPRVVPLLSAGVAARAGTAATRAPAWAPGRSTP